jgi:glycerol-3-phosphate O-acyltransferase
MNPKSIFLLVLLLTMAGANAQVTKEFLIQLDYSGNNLYQLVIHSNLSKNKAYEITYSVEGTDIRGSKIVYTSTKRSDAVAQINLHGVSGENLLVSVCDEQLICEQSVLEVQENPVLIDGWLLYTLAGGGLFAIWYFFLRRRG